MLPAGLEQGARGLERKGDHRRHVDRLSLQANLPVGHARDVEQIVDQTLQLIDLPIDHLPCGFEARRVVPAEAEDLHCGADGGERVSKLVRQHCQELVLPPIRVLDVAIEPGVVEDDCRTRGEIVGQRALLAVVGLARHL
jgi:hypothetical protein